MLWLTLCVTAIRRWSYGTLRRSVPSKHECRRQKAVTAKREYDEWAKSDKREQDYTAAYYYWYNRWRKIRKNKATNPDVAAAFKAGFDSFRREAIKRKRLVRQIDTEEKAFADWLFKQQGEADRLMDQFERKSIINKLY